MRVVEWDGQGREEGGLGLKLAWNGRRALR